MTDQTPSFTDLNDAFGKALLQQFFEPIITSRGPNGEAYYAQSGVSILAQQLFKQNTTLIMDEIWEKLDVEILAQMVADRVIAELLRAPSTYNPNPHQQELKDRILAIVAMDFGKRVADGLDLQLSPKALTEEEVSSS